MKDTHVMLIGMFGVQKIVRNGELIAKRINVVNYPSKQTIP